MGKAETADQKRDSYVEDLGTRFNDLNGHRLASYYEARLLDIKQNVRDIFKEVENTVDIAEEIDVKGMQEKQKKC